MVDPAIAKLLKNANIESADAAAILTSILGEDKGFTASLKSTISLGILRSVANLTRGADAAAKNLAETFVDKITKPILDGSQTLKKSYENILGETAAASKKLLADQAKKKTDAPAEKKDEKDEESKEQADLAKPDSLTKSDTSDDLKNEISSFEKAQEIVITDITPVAGLALKKYLGIVSDNISLAGQKKSKEGDNFAATSGLSKFMLPIMTVIGGLGALAAGLMSDEPAKGFLTGIGKGGLMLGLKSIAKTVGGKLLKTIKFIPFLGTIIDLADAFTRFKNDDAVGGTIALVGGILSLVNLVAPGVGTALSLGASALNAILDAKAGGSSKEASKKKMNLIKGFVQPIIDKVVNWFKSTAVYKFGAGIHEIFTGSIPAGLQQIAGVLTGVPIVGDALSGIISVFAEKVETSEAAAEAAGEKRKPLGTIIKDFIVQKFTQTYAGLLAFGDALKRLWGATSTDEMLGAFTDMGGALGSLPGIGGFFKAIAAFGSEVGEASVEPGEGGRPKGVFAAIRDVLYAKIKAGVNKLPWVIRKAMTYIPGLSNLVGEVADEDEDIPDNSKLGKAELKRAKEEEKKKRETQKAREIIQAPIDELKSSKSTVIRGRGRRTPSINKQDKILELDAQLAELDEKPADDFIIRPGGKIQKFSSDDTIIGAKSGGPLEAALTTLNQNFLTLADAIKTQGPVSAGNTFISAPQQQQEATPPENLPSFKEPNDVLMQRLNFWKYNYGATI